jgi:hypothetical protein
MSDTRSSSADPISALVPLTPERTRGVTTEEQAAQFQNMLNAAHKAQMVGFGLHGSITRTVERVETRRLWLNPLTPLDYTSAELAQMANSLYVKQLSPLIAVPMLDPYDEDAREGVYHDLLIADGMKRYRASYLKMIDTLDVVVEDVPLTLYDVLRNTLARKLTQRPLSERETALWTRNLIAAYEAALVQYPDMPRLTQERLAGMLGIDQGYLSRLLRLETLPARVQELRTLGVLSEAHAVELLPLNDDVAVAAAEEIARRRDAGKPVTQKQARDLARRAKMTGPLVRTDVAATRADHDVVQPMLCIAEVADVARDERIGLLMHDLRLSLEAEVAGRDDVSPAVVRLVRALQAPELVRFSGGFATRRLDPEQ